MKKQFRDFESAREFVRSLGLKGQREWQAYCKSNTLPNDITSRPDYIYKQIGWESWGNWLGTGRVADQSKQYRPFTEAREFVRKLKLKNQKEWLDYCASGDKPNDIPQKVERTYKKDFKGVGDWLGTGNIASQNKIYRPYKEAKEFVRKLKLKNQKEWEEYCKSGDKPEDIPANPRNVYKEWKKK